MSANAGDSFFSWGMRQGDAKDLDDLSQAMRTDTWSDRLECARCTLLTVAPRCLSEHLHPELLHSRIRFEETVSTVGMELLLSAAMRRVKSKGKRCRDGGGSTADDPDDSEVMKSVPRSLRPLLPLSQGRKKPFSAVLWVHEIMEVEKRERMLIANFLTIPEPPQPSGTFASHIPPFHQSIYVAGLRVLLQSMTRDEVVQCFAHCTQSNKYCTVVAGALGSLPFLNSAPCHSFIAYCFPSAAIRAIIDKWMCNYLVPSSGRNDEETQQRRLRVRAEVADRSRQLSALCCTDVWSAIETTQRAQFYPAGKKLHAMFEGWVREIEACKRVKR